MQPFDAPTPARRDRPDVVDRMIPLGVMTAVMWVQEIVDAAIGWRLDRFGIRPRQIDGLDGIVLSPFLHGGFQHLISNTVPFLLLGAAIALGGVRRFLGVVLIVGVIAGVGTWLTGPTNSIHIGASGLVFGFLTYLMARGVFARSLLYLLGGVVVFLIYGSVLWGVLPSPGISWQGHLFGALGGVAAAWLFHADRDNLPAIDA